MTLLVPDGVFPAKKMFRLFKDNSRNINQRITDFTSACSKSTLRSSYRLAATRTACGPSFPCSSRNATSAPSSRRSKVGSMTLLRWK